MTTFLGEYNCKPDEKGRVMLPNAFKKSIPGEARDTFVVKKDIFEKCLVLYPLNEWEQQIAIIRANLNPYNREHNEFIRRFNKGVVEVTLDSMGRLLLPRRLLDEAGIEKEAVMAGQDNKIEMWSREAYDAIDVSGDFAQLAEKVLGGSITKPEKP